MRVSGETEASSDSDPVSGRGGETEASSDSDPVSGRGGETEASSDSDPVSGRGGETEASSDSDPKLPTPMAEPVVGMLEVILTCPRMSGYAGPAWPRFCNLYVGVGGELIGSKMLPFEMDVECIDEDISEREIRRHVRSRAMEDIKQWRIAFRIPVRLGWPSESLDIHVERADYDLRGWRKRLVVTRGGPHTSGYTAVIGRARVRLLDALVNGDEDEEEEAEEKKKRRRNELDTKLEGTVEFGKTVPLLVWEMPPLGDVDRKPRSVVRGTVDVRMCLRRLGRA